jgi:hypothetical protein
MLTVRVTVVLRDVNAGPGNLIDMQPTRGMWVNVEP